LRPEADQDAPVSDGGQAGRRAILEEMTRRTPMPATQLYDAIGTTYTTTRRTGPRIAARIWAAPGDARTDATLAGLPEAELGARLLVA
jgi:hypothetical protein